MLAELRIGRHYVGKLITTFVGKMHHDYADAYTSWIRPLKLRPTMRHPRE